MTHSRVVVEWVFGNILNFFAFIDFKKNLKIGLSSVGTMYTCCALMRDARSCLYRCTTSKIFGLDTPDLMDYFQ